MTVAGNEAVAKVPTVEEEMAKFKGFAVQDGEVSDGKSGSAADARAAAEEAERRAGEANSRTHEENQKAGDKQAEAKSAKVELTADEESEAIQNATDKAGRQLTEDEADEAVEKALADKVKHQNKESGKSRKERNAARFNDYYRRANTAERQLGEERARAADLERRLAALERGEKPTTLTNGNGGDKTGNKAGKPDHTDTQKYPYGELDARYIADLARYETLEAIRAEKEGEKNQQKSQQDAEAEAAFKEAKAAFEEAGIEQFDDFEEVVIATYGLEKGDPGYWPLTQTMAELILDSDQGPAVAYYLASEPKEARRIAALSPARQAAWFGIKEAELSAGSAARSKTDEESGEGTPQAEARTKRVLPQPRNGQARESKAPPPLTKLNGAGGNRVPSSATTNFAEFEALANGTKR